MKNNKRGRLPYSSDTGATIREKNLRKELQMENPKALLERLENIVETEAVDDIELLSALLDVLDERVPLQEADEDPAEGLTRLKEDYASIFELGEADRGEAPVARTPKVFRGVLKYAAVVAVICSTLFVGVIGVQAAGWDIFGALAQWTEDRLYYVIGRTPQISPYYEPFQQALEKENMIGEFAPTWYPSDAQASEPEVWNDKFGTKVSMDLNRARGKAFKVRVDFAIDGEYVDSTTFEKEALDAEPYVSNGKTFLIFDNGDSLVATWSDGVFTEVIAGDLSVTEIKKIINSIGESKNE